MLLDLLLGQPLELAQAEAVILEIRLARHDARAHEERPHAFPFQLARCFLGVEGGYDMVPCGCIPNDPGVHVGARGLR